MPENSEDAERWRLAQANRLLRFVDERGLDIEEVRAMDATTDILDPICDDDGQIVPEAIDLEYARSGWFANGVRYNGDSKEAPR